MRKIFLSKLVFLDFSKITSQLSNKNWGEISETIFGKSRKYSGSNQARIQEFLGGGIVIEKS